MAISQIISRLQRNTMMQAARMRQLERRLKDVERDFDPTALIVSDEDDFVGSGRIFNAISVNSVDEDNPDTVFQDDGTFQRRNTSPSTIVEKRALIRFENPGFSKLVFGAFINIGSVIQTVTDGGGNFIVNFDEIGPFDPTTVTWNNQPTSGSFIAQSLVIGDGWPTSTGVTFTTTLISADGWTFLPLGDSIDSIAIRISNGGGISTGDNTTGVVKIDKDGLSSNSSFYVGLGPVSKITCGDDFAG